MSAEFPAAQSHATEDGLYFAAKIRAGFGNGEVAKAFWQRSKIARARSRCGPTAKARTARQLPFDPMGSAITRSARARIKRSANSHCPHLQPHQSDRFACDRVTCSPHSLD